MAYGIIPFACLVGTAFANGPADVFGFSPAAVNDKGGDRPLAKRQNARCTSSVLSELQPAEPTNSAFASWASSAGIDRMDDPSCSITVPASFSDDFLDYYTKSWKTFYETIESAAAEVTTDCGYAQFGMSLSLLCDESQTIYWEGATETGSASPTATNDDDEDDDDELPSTVLEPLEIPAETIWFGRSNSGGGSGGDSGGESSEDNAGAEKRAMMGFAVTLAGFLGVALVL